jgi:hypothetical protein
MIDQLPSLQVNKVTRIGLHPTAGFGNTGISSPVVVDGRVVALEDPWISKENAKSTSTCACMDILC